MYDEWLIKEEKESMVKNKNYEDEKRELLEIYNIIRKERKRQEKN